MTTRKRSKQRISFTAAATFGAAMSSLYVAPELQADVVDITWNGGNATAVNAYNAGPSTFAVSQGIDQVVGVATVDFVQFNDFIGRITRDWAGHSGTDGHRFRFIAHSFQFAWLAAPECTRETGRNFRVSCRIQ